MNQFREVNSIKESITQRLTREIEEKKRLLKDENRVPAVAKQHGKER